MWDWELLKTKSTEHRSEVFSSFGNESIQYAHAVSYGAAGEEFCLHNHANYELDYCSEGEAVIISDGTRHKMTPGSLLIIHPTVPHKLFISPDIPFDRHIIYLNTIGISSPVSALMAQYQKVMNSSNIGSVFFKSGTCTGLENILAQIESCCRSRDPVVQDLAPYHFSSLVASVIALVKKNVPNEYGHHTTGGIHSLMNYLNLNFTGDLDLSSVAEHFYLSKDYCNRVFRKETGMTIIQYIIYNRILLARQLLSNGVPAGEAAKRIGFKDYSSFYRNYRKITGRKPQDDYQPSEQKTGE